MKNSLPVILMADDDEDDRTMARDALHQSGLKTELRTVSDGEELLEYLQHVRRYPSLLDAPRPALILLDMNMPRMDGCNVLAVLKADPDLRRIPVVILATSRAVEDVVRTYDLGANAYIGKPVTFEELVDVFRTIGTHWLQTVTLASQ